MFQSSSGPSTGCDHLGLILQAHLVHVSILIRPFDRMRRPGCRGYSFRRRCFNPHPALRPDATPLAMAPTPTGTRFNPHPALRPDATPPGQLLDYLPKGFQSSSGPSTGCDTGNLPTRLGLLMFQSSSGPSTGCDSNRLDNQVFQMLFQSSSGPSTGCDFPYRQPRTRTLSVSILIRPFDRMRRDVASIQSDRLRSFNPHPAFRPDATGCWAG